MQSSKSLKHKSIFNITSKSRQTRFKQTKSRQTKSRKTKINNKRRIKPAYNFSYILAHGGIVTTDYDYEIIVPDNIRLIQYTPKGNTLTEMDVLYLFNEFNKNPNNKGIIENPKYFSLNNQKQIIFESDLELNVTEPLEKTLNLFLYYNQNNYEDEFFQKFNNSKKFPVIDRILEEKDDIKSYLHLGLYDYKNDKKFDLEKIGNLDNLLAGLNLNSKNLNTKISSSSKENSFPDYILYSEINKEKNRFTLEEMLVGLSNYYKKKYPGEVVNFVQLSCKEEQNDKAKKFTMTYKEYIENEKNKRFGLYKMNDFLEIRERNIKNKSKNILTIKNIDRIMTDADIIYSNKNDVDFMDISK
jgi:hypothetical protein